mmetsp:Transcript_7760/g.29056  ORF Transcript_7760/g.29056 Transcript_7760/m.29056 type:complete len:219 (+) Transcript_7760:1020-1676(+)
MWQFSQNIERVLKCMLPVLCFRASVSVRFCKLRVLLKKIDCSGELGHWVKVLWELIDDIVHSVRDYSTFVQFFGECIGLRLGWYVTSDEEPEHCLRKWLFAVLCLWKPLLAFWNGESSEADSLIWIQYGGFSNQGFDSSHSTVCHIDGCLGQHTVSVLSTELLHFSYSLWEFVGQDGFQFSSIKSLVDGVALLEQSASLKAHHSERCGGSAKKWYGLC